MRLGIDASNIRTGGGITHLRELLNHAEPEEAGIEEVVVWGREEVGRMLPSRVWLRVITLRQGLGSVECLFWRRFFLPREARARCDLLFFPGGQIAQGFRPVVTMSQNMLPFAPREKARYGFSPMRVRLGLLHYLHRYAFREADGVIFLTPYAFRTIGASVGQPRGRWTIIPHGIQESFFLPLRPPRRLADFSRDHPFQLVATSIIDVYKHPWHIAEAVARLRQEGMPIAVDFYGPAYPPAFRRFQKTLDRLDPAQTFLRYRGAIPNEALPAIYREADAFVFASSCENMPIIMLEAMAAGLPIASSNREPMPEILGESGVYFEPEDPASITSALRTLVLDPDLRLRLATQAQERARQYSWRRCARETFAFLAEIERDFRSRREKEGSGS